MLTANVSANVDEQRLFPINLFVQRTGRRLCCYWLVRQTGPRGWAGPLEMCCLTPVRYSVNFQLVCGKIRGRETKLPHKKNVTVMWPSLWSLKHVWMIQKMSAT